MKMNCYAVAKVSLAALTIAATSIACAVDSPPNEEGGEKIGQTAQAYTGNTCLAAVEDSIADCNRRAFTCLALNGQGITTDLPGCKSPVGSWTPQLGNCEAYRTSATTKCNNGKAVVYRTANPYAFNMETLTPNDRDVIAETFTFAATPQAGASATPIYRCTAQSFPEWADFPSKQSDCEGVGTVISMLGYSYPSTANNAEPVYRCRKPATYKQLGDHYLSYNANCGGNTVGPMLGYAKRL